jgi:dTDP-4-dehydrorhamnose 3,5-epimerase-like enzyme
LIDGCKILVFPVINEQRGELTVIEANRHIPFSIQRVYYMSDVPEDAKRGAHAHKTLHQLIVPIAGSFDVHLDDGKEKKIMHMDRRDSGLYICPMIWRELDNFSSGAVCMVLASDYYNEQDYYRDYDLFLAAINKVIQ